MDTNAPLPSQTSSGSEANQKKDLLKKLMSTVMSKAGSSLHDTIAGITSALGAYKSFAKEWDNLHGVAQGISAGGATGNSAQSVLRGIQQKRETMNHIPPAPMAPAPMPKIAPNQAPKMMPIPQGQQSMPIQAPQSMPPKANLIPNAVPPQNPPQLIAGQEQTSQFNRPAPVSNLGIWGT
jgi:hypothetical protein